MAPPIDIVAAVIRDAAGRVLLVRKRGTRAFMQPGGKREPGEDDLTALGRELVEELGCRMIASGAIRLGVFEAPAANEHGRAVRAVLYAVTVDGTIAPRGEIVEMAWVDAAAPVTVCLAPLTRDRVFPAILSG